MKKEAEKQLSENESEGEDSDDESGSDEEDKNDAAKKEESEPEPMEGNINLLLIKFQTLLHIKYYYTSYRSNYISQKP